MDSEQLRITLRYGMSQLEKRLIEDRDVVEETRPMCLKPEGTAAADVMITCARTGKRIKWNDAVRAGWSSSWKPFTYESPKEGKEVV